MAISQTGIVTRPNIRRAPGEGRNPARTHNRFSSAPAHPAPERRFTETDELLLRSQTMMERLRRAVEARDIP
jgi:hypothetical protein